MQGKIVIESERASGQVVRATQKAFQAENRGGKRLFSTPIGSLLLKTRIKRFSFEKRAGIIQ